MGYFDNDYERPERPMQDEDIAYGLARQRQLDEDDEQLKELEKK